MPLLPALHMRLPATSPFYAPSFPWERGRPARNGNDEEWQETLAPRNDLSHPFTWLVFFPGSAGVPPAMGMTRSGKRPSLPETTSHTFQDPALTAHESTWAWLHGLVEIRNENGPRRASSSRWMNSIGSIKKGWSRCVTRDQP